MFVSETPAGATGRQEARRLAGRRQETTEPQNLYKVVLEGQSYATTFGPAEAGQPQYCASSHYPTDNPEPQVLTGESFVIAPFNQPVQEEQYLQQVYYQPAGYEPLESWQEPTMQQQQMIESQQQQQQQARQETTNYQQPFYPATGYMGSVYADRPSTGCNQQQQQQQQRI